MLQAIPGAAEAGLTAGAVVSGGGSGVDSGGVVDLRRTRTREMADRLVAAAEWTLADDRALVVGMFRDDRSARELALLRGQPARRVRRQLRRAVARLSTPLYGFVVEHRGAWTTVRRRVATACVLHGRTQRQASRLLGVSLHTVAREMAIVEALFRARGGGS